MIREEAFKYSTQCAEYLNKKLPLEKNYTHIVGIINNEIVATAHLVDKNDKLKIREVAVKKNLQNKKIGSGLLKFCENFAISHGYKHIYCYSRITAVNFYKKNGFTPFGEIHFYKDAIPDQIMIKTLPIIP